MTHGGVFLLCICIVAMQQVQVAMGQEPIVDPELRARLEAKVISAMSLKDIEAMVENDERVRNAPKSKLIIIPKGKNIDGLVAEDDREAIIIHRKPKKANRRSENLEYKFPDIDFDRGVRRSYEPAFNFDSEFRDREDDFSSLFKFSDLESASSMPAKNFYESIVSRVMGERKFGLARDPFAVLELAASENVPQYKPRFDYDAYSKDSTETKLQGKPYWKEAPERRDEMIDENGCRTVIKKIVDPEDGKKSSSEKAKSVVITKECEYPNLNGPDAKIAEATPLRYDTSRFDNEPSSEYESEPMSYDKVRPEELDLKKTESRDPLAPDYIDTMLDKHFKSFPGFSNPLSSFRGYQERFKLRTPEAFKDVKPTVGVHTYEYSHPKSGLEEERQSAKEEPANDDAPRTYDHHYHYDYPEQKNGRPENRDFVEESDAKSGSKSANPKDPKMVKKSFAYYRKDNPKEDPNDQQYAEEYAQGNYRSFSSSYDSEKDGPKKKQ